MVRQTTALVRSQAAFSGSADRLALLLLLTVVLSASGCASSKWIAARKLPTNPLDMTLQLQTRGGPYPTDRTRQLLRRYDLVKSGDPFGAGDGDPRGLLMNFHRAVDEHRTAEDVYALAELAYLGGKKVEKENEKSALDLYGASVMNASIYLFDPALKNTRNPYDPQYRAASDLYNVALESFLRIVQKQGVLKPGCTHTITTASRQFDVRVVSRGNGWHDDDFERFEFVSDYQVSGLNNHYRTFGLGVPLIAIRKSHAGKEQTEKYYPPGLSFPVTAFLRIIPATPGAKYGAGNKMRAVLELHDPLVTRDIEVGDRLVPLQSDLTTPLAYFLSQPEFDDSSISTAGLLDPDAAKQLTGMYMLEPYQPGKIPVVLVHGLWSSPVTWMQMYNDLRASPEIRKNYQFWFYLYPTGQPFWFSAQQMRTDLADLRSTLDPGHQEPALAQTVLVGHSMGGLLSRLQVVESGDQFWQIATDKPFQEVKADDTTRQVLQATFFVKPDPMVRRIVTIATPHGGSSMSNGTTRWFGSKLITLPKKLLSGRQKLLRDNPKYFKETSLLNISTSIDSLSPDSPLLMVLREMPSAPWIKQHTIIGQISSSSFLRRIAGTSDGVVHVDSARLESAESELYVSADHSTIHSHPRTIIEVQRILLKHLKEQRLQANQTPSYPIPYPIQPASAVQ